MPRPWRSIKFHIISITRGGKGGGWEGQGGYYYTWAGLGEYGRDACFGFSNNFTSQCALSLSIRLLTRDVIEAIIENREHNDKKIRRVIQ